jgi:hypothetical protein
MKNKIYMRKIIFIFMIFSLVSYSKGLGKITEKFVDECGENNREQLRVLENEQRKMDEYNKLKQELVNSQFPGVVLTEISFCDENDRKHLKILKNENQKMVKIYNKLIQKFDKGGISYYKLKQKLVNSQENWLKSVYEELEDLTKDIFFISVCTGEQFAAEKKISLIQQRIQELTNEYKKYLD